VIRVRIILGALGVALLGVGGVFFLTDLTLGEIAGVVLWLAAAVVVHDGMLVPAVTVADRLLRRTARRLPPAIVAIVESGLAVGVLLTAMVVPELVAQARGPRNPTVVPGDYALRLGLLWVAIAVTIGLLSLVVGLIVGWRARRSARRP